MGLAGILLPCDGRGILATFATLPALTAGIEQAMVPDSNGPPLQSGIWYPSDAPALGWMHPAFPSLSACIQGQTFGTFMNSSRAPLRRTICAPNAGQSTAVVAHPTQACCARALSCENAGVAHQLPDRMRGPIELYQVDQCPPKDGNGSLRHASVRNLSCAILQSAALAAILPVALRHC